MELGVWAEHKTRYWQHYLCKIQLIIWIITQKSIHVCVLIIINIDSCILYTGTKQIKTD